MDKNEDDSDVEDCYSLAWSDEEEMLCTRMADGRKQKKGNAPRKRCRKPQLRDDWRDLVGEMIKISVGMMHGVSNERCIRS